MRFVRCVVCRARRPAEMPSCPVCSGQCGSGPELLKIEKREEEELDQWWARHGILRWVVLLLRGWW